VKLGAVSPIRNAMTVSYAVKPLILAPPTEVSHR
jgi:hypothetical protein